MSKLFFYQEPITGVTTNQDQHALFISENGLPTVKNGSQYIEFGTSGYALQGSSGSSGESGSSGLSGTNGLSGTSGVDGASGLNGLDGTSGISGTSGKDGAQGIAGLNGLNGTSGYSGANGTSGISNGTSGVSGINGTSGLTAVGAVSKGGGAALVNFVPGGVNRSIYQVTFNTPFLDNRYSISTSTQSSDAIDGYDVYITDKDANGFVLNLPVSVPDPSLDDVIIDWLAVSQIETGASGTAGTSGVNGISGSSGVDGTSGESGTSGIDGLNGQNGIDGQAGTSGISYGTSGTSGIDGQAGTSGVNGISGGNTYYFNQSEDSDIVGYKVLSDEPTVTGEQTVLVDLQANERDVLVQQFYTEELGFTLIPAGIQKFNIHALKTDESHSVTAYIELSLTDRLGVPYGQPINSSEAIIPWVDATTPGEVSLDLSLPTTSILATDRIVVKIYFNNNDNQTRDVVWYTEGSSNYSYVSTTVGNKSITYDFGAVGAAGDINFALTGSNATNDVVTMQAGTNITLTDNGSNNFTIDAAGGGGGGGSSPGLLTTTRALQVRPSTLPDTSGTAKQWRLTYIGDTYGTATTSINNNKIKMVAMQFTEGQTVRDVAIHVRSVGGAGPVSIAFYKSELDADGRITGGDLELDCGTVLVDTDGIKIIEGLDHVLGSTTEDVYFLAVWNNSGATVGLQAVNSTNFAGPVAHGSMSVTSYRGNTYEVSSSVLPDSVNGLSWSKATDFPVYGVR